MKPRFLRLSYFVWLCVPLLLWFTYTNLGLPHFRWEYSWRDDGQGYDPRADRYYTRCSYFGPYGEFTLYPTNGHCDIFRFKKNGEMR